MLHYRKGMLEDAIQVGVKFIAVLSKGNAQIEMVKTYQVVLMCFLLIGLDSNSQVVFKRLLQEMIETMYRIALNSSYWRDYFYRYYEIVNTQSEQYRKADVVFVQKASLDILRQNKNYRLVFYYQFAQLNYILARQYAEEEKMYS